MSYRFVVFVRAAVVAAVLVSISLPAYAADPYAKAVVFAQILDGNAGNLYKNPTNALGATDGAHVSLGGPGGSLIVDLGLDGLVTDGVGPDLEIRELGVASGGFDESYRVLVSNSTDTNTFILVGVGRALSLIDINPSGLVSARYVWIQDIALETINDPQTPGSDIDSLRSLHFAGDASVPPPDSVLARLTGQGVWISWLPSPGTNVTGYAIRRSLDGTTFDSTPNASLSSLYTAWHDLNPPIGPTNIYYAVSTLAGAEESTLVVVQVSASQFSLSTNQSVHLGDDVLAGWENPNPQASWTLTFSLADYAAGPKAALTFDLFDVDFGNQPVVLNGGSIGSLPTQGTESWLPRTLEFPAGALQPGLNTLQFYGRNSSGGTSGNWDDFQIRNVGLQFYGSQSSFTLITGARFTEIVPGQTNVTLRWVVEQTPSLSPINWETVSDPIPWTGELIPTNGYYRLRAVP